MQRKSSFTPLLALGVLGLLAGSYGVFEALTTGTAGTNLTSPMAWGLGVSTYLFFLGLSGGGLLLAVLTQWMGQKHLEPLTGLAAWCVVVTEICAGVSIATDLGQWPMLYRFLTAPGLSSPMAWMFFWFTALLLVYVLKIRAMLTGNSALAHKLSALSIPVALLFYLTNGFIFSLLDAQPFWSGAFVAVWFVLAALVSGGALLGLMAWLLGYAENAVQSLGSLLLRLMLVFVLLEFLHIVTLYHAGGTEAQTALHNLLYGSGSAVFWGGHVVLGVLAPCLLLWGKPAASRVGLALALLVAGFAALRWAFVVPVQAVEPLPGLNAAFTSARLSLQYSPSLEEWLLTLFVTSLCLVGLLLGPRMAPSLYALHHEGEGGTHA